MASGVKYIVPQTFVQSFATRNIEILRKPCSLAIDYLCRRRYSRGDKHAGPRMVHAEKGWIEMTKRLQWVQLAHGAVRTALAHGVDLSDLTEGGPDYEGDEYNIVSGAKADTEYGVGYAEDETPVLIDGQCAYTVTEGAVYEQPYQGFAWQVQEAPSLLSTSQAAKALHINERRVRVLCAEGRMGRQVGDTWVITPQEIEANKVRKPGPPPIAYERSGEWSGYKIRKAPTGFVLEFWSRVQGTLTDDKYLLPYGKAAGGYGQDADLDARHNDLVTVGQFLAEYQLRENPHAKILRKGHIVQ